MLRVASVKSDQKIARILVVDDHPILRLGVRQMITADPSLSICGEAETADAALTMVEAAKPDLAIVDLSLDQGTGLDLIGTLHERFPNLPVLVLSMHDEMLYAERALRAGAKGYVMKQEAISGLVKAIHRVLEGHIAVSDRLSERFIDSVGHRERPVNDRMASLTDRELEVFELIGRGSSTSMIAERLHVSVKTIETYRANIKHKLGLKDAHDLIRHATMWVGGL